MVSSLEAQISPKAIFHLFINWLYEQDQYYSVHPEKCLFFTVFRLPASELLEVPKKVNLR